MFILTRLDIARDAVRIYDTSDGTNDVVRLSAISRQIRSKSIRVVGLDLKAGYPDSVYIQNCGVYASLIHAKQEMANYYISKGVSQQDAFTRVGLK